MKVELTQKDLVSLVKGSIPHYYVFNHDLVKSNGSYIGGFYEKWNWSTFNLEKLSEEQLWELYTICRDSWL